MKHLYSSWAVFWILTLAYISGGEVHARERAQTKIFAVAILHHGPDRAPILPLILFANNEGKKLARDYVNTDIRGRILAEYIEPEKVSSAFLLKLYSLSGKFSNAQKSTDYGSTEWMFFTASSNVKIYLDAEAAGRVFTQIFPTIATDSYLLKLAKRLNWQKE